MRISDWSSDVCSSDLVGGESLDLLAVEDGVALEIGDLALALFAVLVGFGCRAAVGVDDERARLALADEAAVLLRLPAGPPHRAGEIGRASCRESVVQYV